MRVLLRQPETGLYLCASGGFSADRDAAKTFDDSYSALRWAIGRGYSSIEICLAFSDASMDMPMKIDLTRIHQPVKRGG